MKIFKNALILTAFIGLSVFGMQPKGNVVLRNDSGVDIEVSQSTHMDRDYHSMNLLKPGQETQAYPYSSFGIESVEGMEYAYRLRDKAFRIGYNDNSYVGRFVYYYIDSGSIKKVISSCANGKVIVSIKPRTMIIRGNTAPTEITCVPNQ